MLREIKNNMTDLKNNAKQKLKVIFAGTPEFAAVSLQALIDSSNELNIDIVAVYTQPDRKAGRGQKVTASAVKEVALAHNIPVEQPETFSKAKEGGLVSRETLANYDADVMVVAAYGLILPVGVLNTPRLGCINIHGSLLPRWRGAAPIHRAILAGDTQTGITIMQMDKGLDTGDMLYKVACDIEETDTTASLHDKLANLGAEAVKTVLADLPSYQAKAEKQDDHIAQTPVTYAEKLSKEEGQIDWTKPATDIARQIRGMYPYPSTFGFIAGKRVKVIEALPINPTQTTNEPAGTVISVGKKAILVACGKNANDQGTTICLTKLQFAGGKALTAEQICTGNKLNDGDRFDV